MCSGRLRLLCCRRARGRAGVAPAAALTAADSRKIPTLPKARGMQQQLAAAEAKAGAGRKVLPLKLSSHALAGDAENAPAAAQNATIPAIHAAASVAPVPEAKKETKHRSLLFRPNKVAWGPGLGWGARAGPQQQRCGASAGHFLQRPRPEDTLVPPARSPPNTSAAAAARPRRPPRRRRS